MILFALFRHNSASDLDVGLSCLKTGSAFLPGQRVSRIVSLQNISEEEITVSLHMRHFCLLDNERFKRPLQPNKIFY